MRLALRGLLALVAAVAVYAASGCPEIPSVTADAAQVKTLRPNGQGGHGDWTASPPTDMLANDTMESASWNGSPKEVRDATNNGVHGASVGGVTTANASAAIPGDPGTCRYATGFNGSTSYLDLGTPQFTMANQVTVMAWVRWGVAPASGSPWASIVSNNSPWTWDYGQFWLQHSQDNSKFEFAVNTAGGHSWVQSSVAPQQGMWQHVAGVYDGTTLTIYVNGVASGTASLTGNVVAPAGEFQLDIGRWGLTWGDTRSFNGDIDEVRIYPRALSATDVTTVMSATHPCSTPPATDMLANYTMESASWNGSAGEVRDATGNGFNGWSVGGAQTASASSAITGDPGSCRYASGFNGSTSYLEMTTPQFAFTNQATVMAWVRWGINPANGDPWANIVSNNSYWTPDYGQFWLQHSQDNSKFEFAVETTASSNYVQSSVAPTQGQWQHVAGVYDGNTLTIYVNGAAAGTAVLTGNIMTPQAEFNLRMGRWAWETQPRSFTGDIDEVRVYPRALSAGDVAAAMSATHPCSASEPGAAHYLNVDEATADNDTSQISSPVIGAKDTHVYPGANLPSDAIIDNVSLKFAWKHYDPNNPSPAGPDMYAIFRQNGADTRGPTYQSTNAAGWVNGQWNMTANPRTGQGWTLADVNNGLEFGSEVYPTAGAWPYATQEWVEVTYHETANTLPSPSGATTPFPANSSFTAGEQVASVPPNNGFESPQDPVTKVIPGWTIVGNANYATTPSGGHSGSYYLQILGGGCLCPEVISSPFTLTSAGQSLIMWLNSFGSNAGAYVYVATAPYTNWNQIWSGGPGSSSNWGRQVINLDGYIGQTIELRLRADGLLGFDDIAWETEIPNWSASGGGNGAAWLDQNATMPATTGTLGNYSNSEVTCKGATVSATGAGGGGFSAHLKNNASIVSGFFTVPGDGTRLTLHAGGSGIGPGITVNLYTAADNPPYSVQHVLYNAQFTGGGAAVYTSCDINHFAGQEAYIQIQSSFPGEIGVAGILEGVFLKFKDQSQDPVSFTTGALSQQHTDMVVPGKGVPLQFTRYYSSQSRLLPGSFGWGWTNNYDERLLIFTDGSAEVQYPDGNKAFFTNNSGTLVAPTGVTDKLVLNVDGTYTLTTPAQARYNFDATGKLTNIKDRNNNTTSLSYNGSGFLSAATDPGGRQLVFTTDTYGRITQVAAPLSRTISYAYNANGDLVTVTDARGGTTAFAYSNHRLTSITDALNHVVATNIYDTANRVVEQRDGVNNTSCFYYGIAPAYTSTNCPGISPAAQPGQTIMVDPRGNKQVHQFDTRFRPTGVADGLGHAVTYAYEVPGTLCSAAYGGNLCSVSDGLSHTTSFTYDTRGNALTTTDANNKTTTYTYDSLNDVLTATDPLSRVTTFAYNGSGNLTSVTDALSHVTTYTPNGDGTLASVTDPLNHTQSLTYDTNGNLHTATDALNHTATAVYDAGGRMTSATDALSHTTTSTYDNLNNPLSVTDPLNHTTSYGYDAKGQRTSVTDANNKTTTYAYDNAGRLTTVTDPLSHAVAYAYDGDGNRTSLTDTRGKTTTYVYDAADRLASETDPLNRATTYTYDAANRLISRQDAKNQTTSYSYDILSRLTGVGYPFGTPNVSYTYDAMGNRLTMTNGTGTTTYAYDALYRPTSVTDGASSAVGYGYDAANRLTSITYPSGIGTAAYGYDAADRLTSVTDWNNQATSYGYDNANRLTSTGLPNGVTETRTYDNANRLLTILTVHGGTTIVSYGYTVDPVGNRTQVVDTNGTTTFGYDGLYRVNAVTYPNGDTQSYTFDPMGNRLTKVNNGSTTSYTYDNGGQMTAAGAVIYGYDNNGSQTSAGTDTFAYNAANRLVLTNIGGVAGGYAYNGDGLRTLRSIGGVTTSFAWGQVGGMPVVLADGAGDKYLYGLGLISRTDSQNAKFYYHTDGLGSTTAVTGATGTVLNTYQYDVYGAVRAQTGTTPNEFTYTAQRADSSGLQYLRARYYDPAAGRFLTKDPLPLLQRYAYVGGNPANFTDPTGLCGGTCVWNSAKDAFDKAGSLIADCIGSDTCTKMVGEGIFLVGAVTGNPLVMAIGVGVMASVDAPDCIGGSAMGCVNLALDAALLVGAAGEGSIYGALKEDLAAAVRQFEEEGLTRRQAEAVARNPKLYSMFKGERIDTFAKAIVRADSRLNTKITVTPRFTSGPDFVHAARGTWYDVTTAGQWPAHIAKYGEMFGAGEPLFYR